MAIKKVSELINDLQEILKEEGDLPVIYSTDDEGNGFHYQYGAPTVGSFYEKDEEFSNDPDRYKVKVVCIN